MCSASVSAVGFLLVAAMSVTAAEARELRFCVDPNNLPYSDSSGGGFENRIADIVAEELGAERKFVWAPLYRGFVRKTLNAGLCDVIPGVPAKLERLRTTRPYYVGSYVFAQREGSAPISTFDDPVLRTAQIGVQLVGNDAANTPPMDALARRGINGNVQGFMVFGDRSEREPLSPIMAAVANGSVDVALVWGPVAGFFAHRENKHLQLTTIEGGSDPNMSFAISMGVRKEDAPLAQEIDRALERRKSDIDAVLAEFGVPRVQVRQFAPAVLR
jgi:mxaJ protein